MNDDELIPTTAHHRSWPPDADVSFSDSADMDYGKRDAQRFYDLAQHADAIGLLCAASIPQDEIDAARERVRTRIFAEIAADSSNALTLAEESADGIAATGKGKLARWRAHIPTFGRLSRIALVAATIALIATFGLTAMAQANVALPESPFYSLKRLEERIALDTAGSDTQRGAALATIAHHRLDELVREAAQNNTTETRQLAAEFDATVRQLIRLVVSMTANHENVQSISASLANILSAEDNALAQAHRQGQTQLEQTLNSTSQALDQEISAQHLVLPGVSDSHAQDKPATPRSSSGKPSPTPGPPVPHGGQGAGQGAAGQGGGKGSGGSSDNHGHGSNGSGGKAPSSPNSTPSTQPPGTAPGQRQP